MIGKKIQSRMNCHKKAQKTQKQISVLRLLCFFVANLVFLFPAFAQTEIEPQTGDEIAEQLRTMQPGGNTEISGILIINEQKKIPVVCKIVTNQCSWKVIYETRLTANIPDEKFVAVHSLDGPNKYLLSRGTNEPKPIKAEETAIPFAGTDFWLSELGFDFLHWPQQNKLPGQMRLGQPCYVLESINPDAPVVVRMKSFIEKESGGILVAEGYDRKHRKVKEFSLAGSSFKKVNGQWQLKKMTIRSPREDSETILEFELPPEAGK